MFALVCSLCHVILIAMFANSEAYNQTMHFTCNSCKLEFSDLDGQKTHMRSEWHRYNLKRRVAQLPPVDEVTFETKVSVHAVDSVSETGPSERQSKKEIRRLAKEAIVEKRRQLLQQSLKSGSPQTARNISSEPVPHEIESDVNTAMDRLNLSELKERDEEELILEKINNKVDIPITTCLFCQRKENSSFQSVEENLSHMRIQHGLYVPEKDYLADIDGLLNYLGQKIGYGNVCLCCLYQGKDIVAVRDHMQRKRHMKIPYETEDERLEISDFYDFSLTYNSAETGDDNEWEDVSEGSGTEEDDDFTEDLINVQNDVIYRDGLNLILPSGAVLGNRAYARYYRQNLPPDRILSEGQGTVIAAESRHMLHIKDHRAAATQKRAWVRQKKREDINDRRSAKFINNQPHFRDPLLQ